MDWPIHNERIRTSTVTLSNKGFKLATTSRGPVRSPELSGLVGVDTTIYKLEVEVFRQHLNAIRSVVRNCRTALEYHGAHNECD